MRPKLRFLVPAVVGAVLSGWITGSYAGPGDRPAQSRPVKGGLLKTTNAARPSSRGPARRARIARSPLTVPELKTRAEAAGFLLLDVTQIAQAIQKTPLHLDAARPSASIALGLSGWLYAMGPESWYAEDGWQAITLMPQQALHVSFRGAKGKKCIVSFDVSLESTFGLAAGTGTGSVRLGQDGSGPDVTISDLVPGNYDLVAGVPSAAETCDVNFRSENGRFWIWGVEVRVIE